jgi:hypothetical protein
METEQVYQTSAFNLTLKQLNAEGFSVFIYHESLKSYTVESMLQKRSFEALMCCVCLFDVLQNCYAIIL